LAQVRDLLGHASIVTTERYDNQTLESLQLAAARLESGKSFDSADTRVNTSSESVSEEREIDTAARPRRGKHRASGRRHGSHHVLRGSFKNLSRSRLSQARKRPFKTGLESGTNYSRKKTYLNGTGTGIRTPVPWLRTTCPDP
jgi:hypothetical protein